MSYSMVELIGRKRDGGVLEPDALRWIIAAYTADQIPDYQLSALLMAIVLNGMDAAELAPWTDAMLHSGETLHLDAVDKPIVDKHSTGGVGDKISIPLAPIVAACGAAVPMMSGRGLGHTGGTLDKLESIPGFSTQIAPEQFVAQLSELGVVMVGQTEMLVPADRRIYALRDATGTVPSIPLISSSIMSKKLAEDLDGLLLDVKVGSGAFMKTKEDAELLARTMVGIGQTASTPVTALLTDMSQPLGRAVGNANEIAESVAILQGQGPDDVRDLTLRCAEEMLTLTGSWERDEAANAVLDAISSGAALDVMIELTRRQGGDPRFVEDPTLLDVAPYEYVLESPQGGFVTRCDALSIGVAGVRLGAGRATKEALVDPGVGFIVEAKVGDPISAGDPLVRIAYRDEKKLDDALNALGDAWQLAEERPPIPDLVMGVIT
jgi:pyrimidine-nucleoside phosphorylase